MLFFAVLNGQLFDHFQSFKSAINICQLLGINCLEHLIGLKTKNLGGFNNLFTKLLDMPGEDTIIQFLLLLDGFGQIPLIFDGIPIHLILSLKFLQIIPQLALALLIPIFPINLPNRLINILLNRFRINMIPLDFIFQSFLTLNQKIL